MRSLAFVLAWSLAGCGAPAAGPAEEGEPGILRLGRNSESGGVRYTLSARFDAEGPMALELDTDRTSDAAGRPLATGSYAITIRHDYSLWRDIAVAQIQAPAELASDAEQRFEITPGASTLVAYEFVVDGKTVSFESP